MEEKEKIEHQLELATRVAQTIKDETTVQRLRNFADDLRQTRTHDPATAD